MPEVYDSQLKLSLLAEPGDTEEVLTSLSSMVDKFASQLKDLGLIDVFGKLQSDAESFGETLSGLSETMDKMHSSFSQEIPNVFAPLQESASQTATDLDRIVTSMDKVKTALESDPKSPFGEVDTGAIDLSRDLDGTYKAYQDFTKLLDIEIKSPFGEVIDADTTFGDDIKQTQSAYNQFVKDLDKTITANPLSDMDSYLTETIGKLETAVNLMDKLTGTHEVNIGGASSYDGTVGTLPMGELNALFNTLDDRLQTVDGTMKALSDRISESLSGSGGGSIGGKSSKSTSFVPSLDDFMTAGMASTLATMGIGQLVSASSNLGYIEEMMQVGQGKGSNPSKYSASDVNSAARAYSLLGEAGIGGSQSVGFLTQLSSKLQTLFTQYGHGGLGKEGNILQESGLTSADVTQSPYMLLQSLQKSYSKLLAKDPTQASQFANLAGIQQLTPLFSGSIWQTAQQAVSGVNMGMNGSELSSAVKSTIETQGSIQTLITEFDGLAGAMMPVVNVLAKLGEGFMTLNNWVGKITKPVLSDNVVTDPFIKGGKQIDRMFQQMDSELSKDWPVFTSAFGRDLGGTWKSVQKDWDNFPTNLSKALGSMWQTYGVNEWKQTETGFAHAIGNLWANVGGPNWLHVGDSFGSAIADLWPNFMKTNFDKLGSEISNAISGWVQQAANLIGGVALSTEGGIQQSLHNTPVVGHLVGSGLNNEIVGALMQNNVAHGLNVKASQNAVTHNINVTVSGGTKSEDALAKKIAQQVLNGVKLTSNIDLSY